MATSVSGPLRLVTDVPASFVQVVVRAPRSRPYAGGMVVDFTSPAAVSDGVVEFPCVPGPAVLVVMSAGVPQVTVPLVVPDKPSASLEECMRAAELADTATRSELEDLARRIVEGVSQAEQAAASAQESAAATEADRLDVAKAREIIDGYRAQVTAAHGETLAARDVAVGAADTATTQAETATDRAGAADESAAAAGQSEVSAAESVQEATRQADRATGEADRSEREADRAAQAAADSSVKAVAEKVDELLAGAPEAYDTLLEIAIELERGRTVEAALIKEISGKAPAEHTHTAEDVGAAPASHTHTVGDVSGLQAALDGKAAASHTHAIADTTGLQSALDGKANKVYVDARTPKIVTVTALPASPDPSAVYLVTG